MNDQRAVPSFFVHPAVCHYCGQNYDDAGAGSILRDLAFMGWMQVPPGDTYRPRLAVNTARRVWVCLHCRTHWHREKRAALVPPQYRSTRDRDNRIRLARDAGDSPSQIAAAFGLSRQRVHQIIAQRFPAPATERLHP